jgi:hypothetical protein
MNNQNNIPAFPLSVEQEHFISLGMTLKDYYAGQALMGFISKGASIDNAVHWSWLTAEKMLNKREERKDI